MNGKRRKLQLKRIQDKNGIWIEDESDSTEEAIHFFKQQFHEPSVPTDFTILDHVPVIMNDEQNIDLTR